MSLGQQKVGIPQKEVFEALFDAASDKSWSDFNQTAVMYYMERMLFSHLLGIMAKALSDEDLEKLEARSVHQIHLLLLRDHFRHNTDLLRPSTKEEWVEPFFHDLFQQFDIATNSIEEFDTKFDLETFNAPWAVKISEPFGLESHKLFMAHTAIVTGVREEQGFPPLSPEETVDAAYTKQADTELTGEAAEIQLWLERHSFSSDPIKDPFSLTSLNIYDEKLSEVPEWIGRLSDLESLSIGGGTISTLPSSIADLDNLKKLDISDNEFTTIPECVLELTTLEELNARENPIVELPESFGRLTQLRVLLLTECALSSWRFN